MYLLGTVMSRNDIDHSVPTTAEALDDNQLFWQVLDYITANYNFWVAIILMMVGFYAVIHSRNLIKKLMGIAIFQTSVLLMYISASNVSGGHVPILQDGVTLYNNPLPHVLMLTAIVVGVATLAVGLALAVRIKQAYGTVEEDEVLAADIDHLHKRREEEKQEHYVSSTAAESATQGVTSK